MADIEKFARATVAVTLWDDNPADVDLLGFDAVVAPVLAALRQPDLDPITVGVHAPWGGGKSSLLHLIESAAESKWIVVRTSPWEYEDQLDVKGQLIAEVLAAIQGQVKATEDITDRFAKLFRRISWSRVGLAVAKGALTMQWDPEKLVDAFTPMKEDGPQSLADFRREFAALIGKLPYVDRVVVLVDDLDRCLPEAVVATLEAIKLFLSVKKMAFVIAADQDMVRDGIAASLAGTNRSETFAEHYLEKIVQLPVSLPRLSPVESEAYIGLLLTRAENGGAGFEALVAHCADRRRKNLAPLLGDLDGLAVKPSEATLQLAAQLNDGLLPSKRGNPREIKRFLNAFGVRSQIATTRGLTITPPIMIKMLLLEERYRKDFETLVALPDAERSRLLRDWEAWGRGETDVRPDEISELSRAWAGSEPRLAEEELNPYITLAATLVAASLGAALTDELRTFVRQLLSETETLRDEAKEAVGKRPAEDQRQVASALLDEARRAGEDGIVFIVQALISIAVATPDLASDLAREIHQRLWRQLDAASAYDVANSDVPDFVQIARDLANDDQVVPGVREAAGIAMEGK